MAYNMFLKIDGIDGDSQDANHKKWIEVQSYAHKMSQAAGGTLSAHGAHTGGRVDHEDFTLSKRLDSASPILAQYCCMGKHIPKVTFEVCRALGDQTTFMVYEMSDVIISSVSPVGSAEATDPLPRENITIRYSMIRWMYTPTDTKGNKGGVVQAGWSTQENRTV